MKTVAIVCARGLGDALLSMILSENLLSAGFRVTTFSSVLCGLQPWFPHHHILPYPKQTDFQKTFSAFDEVIAADHAPVQAHHAFGNRLTILKESAFNKSFPLAKNLQLYCKDQLSIAHAKLDNGIRVPDELKWRLHQNRVIIHPMSLEQKRTWPADKFLRLGEKLEEEGFKPIFCVSPSEYPAWQDCLPHEKLPLFPTISHLASFIYESGYLIGNNSGLGHLASVLNVPTLSLFARKSYARLWRPGWGPGLIVTPFPIAIGSRMKERLWKQTLSVGKVLRAFYKLRGKNASASLPLRPDSEEPGQSL